MENTIEKLNNVTGTDVSNFISKTVSPITDGSCSEPIMWGHRIVSRMGEELFNKVRANCRLECIEFDWFIITKVLSREEAIEKYGEITNEEFGVRGGWKSVTFGNKRFISKTMRKVN